MSCQHVTLLPMEYVFFRCYCIVCVYFFFGRLDDRPMGFSGVDRVVVRVCVLFVRSSVFCSIDYDYDCDVSTSIGSPLF